MLSTICTSLLRGRPTREDAAGWWRRSPDRGRGHRVASDMVVTWHTLRVTVRADGPVPSAGRSRIDHHACRCPVAVATGGGRLQRTTRQVRVLATLRVAGARSTGQ